MTRRDPDEEGKIVAEYAAKYDPLITVEQAGEIAHAPVATIHLWSSSSRMDTFKVKVGRRVLFRRDDFVRFVLAGNPKNHSHETSEANV